MKGIACGACGDFRALPRGDYTPVSCACGNTTGFWIQGAAGIARFHARNRSMAFGMGVHNGYLTAALSNPPSTDEGWRELHDTVCDAPRYLFDRSRRGCWALIFKPGTTSDTAWATDDELVMAGLIESATSPGVTSEQTTSVSDDTLGAVPVTAHDPTV